jgi:hypothetical protein
MSLPFGRLSRVFDKHFLFNNMPVFVYGRVLVVRCFLNRERFSKTLGIF